MKNIGIITTVFVTWIEILDYTTDRHCCLGGDTDGI